MIFWYAEDVRSNKKRISPCFCLLSIDTEHGASKWYEWPNRPPAYLRKRVAMLLFELRSKEGGGRDFYLAAIWSDRSSLGARWGIKVMLQEARVLLHHWHMGPSAGLWLSIVISAQRNCECEKCSNSNENHFFLDNEIKHCNFDVWMRWRKVREEFKNWNVEAHAIWK